MQSTDQSLICTCLCTSTPVPDGGMRGLRSIRNTLFSTWESPELAQFNRSGHRSERLPSASNRRTRRLSMLSILPTSNAARWNCHDGTNRSNRALCIRQQLRPLAGSILRAGGADLSRLTPPRSVERQARPASRNSIQGSLPHRKASISSLATGCPRQAIRSPWLMPATSSGHSCLSLGDGRAILLGEVVDRDGARRDIQLKGSGPTPFSRQGDGRAALGPVLREYIVSEAICRARDPDDPSARRCDNRRNGLARDGHCLARY